MRKIHWGIPITAVLLFGVGLSVSPVENDKLASNKAVVRSYFEVAWNGGELDLIDEIYAPEYGEPDGIQGPEGVKAFIRSTQAGLPDIQFTVEDLIAEGAGVAVRWRIHATHEGEFMGIPRTGKPVTVTGMSFYQLANGKIVESWSNWDELGLFQQLGITPEE